MSIYEAKEAVKRK